MKTLTCVGVLVLLVLAIANLAFQFYLGYQLFTALYVGDYIKVLYYAVALLVMWYFSGRVGKALASK